MDGGTNDGICGGVQTADGAGSSQAAPRHKPYKLAAGGGLYLEVMPTGAKY